MRTDRRTAAAVARAGEIAVPPRGGGNFDWLLSLSSSLSPLPFPLTAAAVEAWLASYHPPPNQMNYRSPLSPPLPSASQVRMLAHTINIAHKHSLNLVGITLVSDLPHWQFRKTE